MEVREGAQWRAGQFLVGALSLIAALHAYWALGGRWGLAAALGGHDKAIPPAWAIWLVTGLLVAGVVLVLARLGLWGTRLPHWVVTLGCWVMVLAFVFAAVINYSADTAWEVFCFGPVATLLAGATVLVAVAKRQGA